MSFNQSWILTKVEYAADFCKLKQETHDKGSSFAFSYNKNFIIAYLTKMLVIKSQSKFVFKTHTPPPES